MRVLVTGGSGFLGAAATALLKRKRAGVIHLARRLFSSDETLLWDFKSFLPRLPTVDACIHMAASVDFSGAPCVLADNIVPALRLAEWASETKTPLYFTSTAAVHGKNQPWGAATPISPENHYAASKLAAEECLRNFSSPLVIYRPSGLYGRGGPRHLYLNRAIDEALDKRVPPRLVGSGAALRNYIGVEDAAAWIVHDVLSSRTHNAPVYIAGGETLPIRNWLEGITEILLDGQSLTLLPGDSGSDVLVEQTPPPVSLTPFKRYLQKLHAERVG